MFFCHVSLPLLPLKLTFVYVLGSLTRHLEFILHVRIKLNSSQTWLLPTLGCQHPNKKEVSCKPEESKHFTMTFYHVGMRFIFNITLSCEGAFCIISCANSHFDCPAQRWSHFRALRISSSNDTHKTSILKQHQNRPTFSYQYTFLLPLFSIVASLLPNGIQKVIS